MTKIVVVLCTVVCCFTFSPFASAEEGYTDAVYLKNGSIIRGLIVERVPGVSLKIEMLGGNVLAFRESEVAKIAREKNAAETTAATATAKDEQTEFKMELTGIIRERTFYTDSGLQAMSDIAGQLAETNRYFMYYTNRRDDAVPAFVLNLLVGSLESWVQTDFASAVIQDILYVGGLSAVLTAPLFNDRQTSMAVMWSGVGVIGCAWLIGVVTPWTFENHWNTRLASGLNVHIGR